MILETILIGFFTAFGWFGANHYVIEPYLEQQQEAKP
jgi:hypothetical protein